MKLVAKGLMVLVGALCVAQLVSVDRTNPPVQGEISAPPDVKTVLRRACYDCHSNETKWPWYSRVAPMSWLVHRDVVGGRKHVNFSEWAALPPEKKKKKQKKAGEEVSGGDMPLWFYLPLHPDARLSDADKQVIARWVAGPTSD
ncbi:MAG TPA: heme-binding domain-containing protein [Polyangiaceae bacterium]